MIPGMRLRLLIPRDRLPGIALDYALIILGGLLNAAAVDMFMVPNEVVAGGVTGVSIILHHTAGLPVGGTLFVLNLPLLWVGWRYAGGVRFFVRTLVGVTTVSAAVDLLAPVLPAPTTDRLLIIFYGGLMSGLGLALVFRGRGTTGGLDVIGRVANRLFGLPIGQTMLAFNILVYAAAGLIFGPEPAMVALLLSFVAARTIDAVMHGLSATRSAFIITGAPDPVRASIIANLHRGVTVIEARGGYTGESRTILYVVVARSEAQRLKVRVLEVDPHAFIAIYAPREVLGGFPLRSAG